jgi:hypothetical protein
MNRLTNSLLAVVFVIAVTTVLASAVMATTDVTIEYTLTDLGSSMFRYDWNVKNDPLSSSPIEWFTIYFESASSITADTLSVEGVASDWTATVTQPDTVPDPDVWVGYYDAYTFTSPIIAGGSLSGFSASFKWLGTGTPSSSFFDIFAENNVTGIADVVDSGWTVKKDSGVVPEASTFAAFGSLISLFVANARLRRRL